VGEPHVAERTRWRASPRFLHGAMNTTPPAVILEPVTRDNASTLDHLFELYVYDFSEHLPIPIQPSGRFEITPGDAWWTRDAHFGYLIKRQDQLAGFALVREGSRLTGTPDVMDVAEFFVLRGVRGKGIGKSAAHLLFDAFPRSWEIRVRRTNPAALEFWSRAAEGYVGQPVASSPFSIEGVDWDVLRLAASRK
jgi:predicted acetyltransferase